MKIQLPCVNKICHTDIETSGQFFHVEINDSGLYEVICAKGHKNIFAVQQEKFEILFDLAAMAFIDGYTRESVTNIASSLERFYEFCIRVLMHKEIPVNEMELTWKLVKKQSERQLGAFYLIYLTTFKETFVPLHQNWVTFRNAVIHEGYIPSASEVIEYADAVLQHIFIVLTKIKSSHQKDILNVIISRMTQLHAKYPHEKIVNAAIPTIVGLDRKDPLIGQKNFEDLLKEVKIYKAFTYSNA